MNENENSINQHDEFDTELMQTLNKIFRDYRIGMNEFNEAMKKHEQINLRVEQRTTRLAYFSVGTLIFMMSVLVFFVFTFTSNLKLMSEQIGLANHNVVNKMDNLKQAINEVNTNLPKMDDINASIQRVQKNVAMMNDNLADIAHQVGTPSQQTETRLSRYYDFPPRYSFPRR